MPKVPIQIFCCLLIAIATLKYCFGRLTANQVCKQLDKEPPKAQQVIEFHGGRVMINASFSFQDKHQRWQKFVALNETAKASLESPKKDWNLIHIQFDCARITIKLHNKRVLFFLIDYSPTSILGYACETTQMDLTNLEIHSQSSSYLGFYCSLTAPDFRPLLAVRDIKIELPV